MAAVHYVVIRPARVRIVGADEDNPQHLAAAARHKGLLHKLVVSVLFESEDSLGLRPAFFEVPTDLLLQVTKGCVPCNSDRELFTSQRAQDHSEPCVGCDAAGHRCTLRRLHVLDGCGAEFLSLAPHRHYTNWAPGCWGNDSLSCASFSCTHIVCNT